MNRIYRTVFNRTLGAFQVVSELAHCNRGGKISSAQLAVTSALLLGISTSSNAALDIGGYVGSGVNTITSNNQDVVQTSSVFTLYALTVDAGTGNITLQDPGNHFTGLGLRGNDVLLDVNGYTDINGITANTLNYSTTSTIYQTGAIQVSGTSTFSAGGLVSLENAANTFGGPVNIDAQSFIRLVAANNLILGTVSGTNVTLSGNSGITVNGDVTASGNLSLRSNNAAIVQTSSALTVAGSTTINAGSGTISLVNVGNTFAGPVIVTGGQVEVTGSGDLNINANVGDGTFTATGNVVLGTSTVGNELTVTTDNHISQTGAVTVNAATSLSTTNGDIILANAGNDFGGAVTVASAGAVSLRDSNDLHVATLTNGANSAVSLVADGDLTLDTAISTGTADLTLTSNGSGTLALTHALSGNHINLSGGGTIVLSNDITATNTHLTQGTLQIGTGGTTGRLIGDIALESGTVLTFDRSDAVLYAGQISGDGAVTLNGAVTLTGENTYTGATHLAGGTLVIGDAGTNGSLASDVVINNGALVFDRADTLTYSGDITGSGTVAQNGGGTLILEGNSQLTGLSSATEVNHGSLIVGGSAGSTASLTSAVSVASGALLGGHGSIVGDVTVASGATLAPGHSIGTLSVTGNVNLAAGALFEVQANPDGSADRLTATGDVSLNGATLSLLAANGTWAPFTTYTIISANSVTGMFSTPVVSNLAFLQASLDYSSGNSVALTLARNDIEFAAVANTSNQRASATALEALGLGNGLYNAVGGLSVAAAQVAFDSLSGELHASLQTALLDDSRYLREGLNQRLLAAQGLTRANGVLNSRVEGPTFWLQGYGGWARNDGDGNAAQLDHDSQGTLLGGDIALNDTWRVGAAVGLGSSDIDQNERHSSADVDSQSLALYASAQWNQMNLRLGAGRTWNSIDSRRQVQVGAVNEREKARYDATTTQLFSELGYRLNVATVQLEPFVGLAHVQLDGDGFNEHGGTAALSGKGEKQDISYSTLGLRGSVPLADVAGLPVSAQGGLSWQHAFGGDTPDSRLAFSGGDSFQVQGTPLERNSAVAELGVQAQVAATTTVGLSYSGRLGEDYRDNGVRLSVNVGF